MRNFNVPNFLDSPLGRGAAVAAMASVVCLGSACSSGEQHPSAEPMPTTVAPYDSYTEEPEPFATPSADEELMTMDPVDPYPQETEAPDDTIPGKAERPRLKPVGRVALTPGNMCWWGPNYRQPLIDNSPVVYQTDGRCDENADPTQPVGKRPDPKVSVYDSPQANGGSKIGTIYDGMKANGICYVNNGSEVTDGLGQTSSRWVAIRVNNTTDRGITGEGFVPHYEIGYASTSGLKACTSRILSRIAER